jgi:hypothetical protein
VFEFDGETRSIADSNGDTLGYFQAGTSGDVETFRLSSPDAKPTMRRVPFDRALGTHR